MTTASSVRSSLPDFAPFDFGAVDDSGRDRIFVGTGPDGLPVGPDWGEVPHLLFLGVSGAGKSVGMAGVLHEALVKGYRGVVIDTARHWSDLWFADGYVDAFATTTLDALTALRNVYSETRHPSPDLPPVVVVIDNLWKIVAQNPIPQAETEDRHPSPELSALLVLLASDYKPHTKRERPTGRIVWLDPTTEVAFLRSLAELGLIHFRVLDPTAAA